eukprot:TRINITY_DN1443_c0_g1_i2.p2 TRINITY_DN1443_c0_g1~~TRINITY_DN1443_c0_g1_i2.p2  ORF type:complete len:124 (-),score=28.98 TRINITY_DN1443_c0_g1_i2:118-489(-)
MSAGPRFEYFWADGEKVKQPIKCTAPEYVDYLMTWIQGKLDDEKIFSNDGNFPPNFLEVVKTIFKRMFRVFAHIYHLHYETFAKMGEEAHLNNTFRHFYLFANEFDLIDKKEQAPLEEIISKF